MPKDHNAGQLDREAGWLVREKYGGRMTSAAKRDIKRLGRGEHVNYVIGWSPFLGCRIDLSARPLIPRPETEYWTERAIEEIRASGKKEPRALDLFCGSGCIGTAVLRHVPRAQVDFADINKNYFPGIRKSLRASKLSGRRAGYICSDAFKNIGVRKYDYILANPPYIPTTGRAVAKSVLSQEPKLALFAGKDGLKFIKKILREAGGYLAPGGVMFLEFDPFQKQAIAAYAARKGWGVDFSKDQYGRWRSVRLSSDEIRNKKAVQ